MKKLLIILIACLANNFVFAQQQGQFSQYMMNYYLLNPAVAGSDNDIDLKSSFRHQWVGMNGAPVNYYLSGSSTIGRLSGVGGRAKQAIGGIITGQQLGAFKRNGVYVSYAYHYSLSENTYLSAGLSFGALAYQLNNNLDFGDNTVDAAAQNINNQIRPDANAGLFLYSKKFFVGLSSMQLFKSSLNFGSLSEKGYLSKHYYFFSGYHINLNENMVLVPSVLIKSVVPTALQFDINAKLKYQNKYWLGVSYRNKDAIIAMLGLMINDRVEFGYSYDITTSGLRFGSKGTHEILLGLRLKRKITAVCPSDYW
jgi:type IX secretion system PorP/SprF family membrane protein